MANAMKVEAALKKHMGQMPNKAHPSVPKFKKGGPTTDDRKNLGRGPSRVDNQKTG